MFVGTRVPSQTLLDYLEGGQPLAEFFGDFPTVSWDQAVAALGQAKEALFRRCVSCFTQLDAPAFVTAVMSEEGR